MKLQRAVVSQTEDRAGIQP